MKVNFIATTKRISMPKGITLKIEGQAEVPKGMARADLIKGLKEYAVSQMKVRNYCLTTECIDITLN